MNKKVRRKLLDKENMDNYVYIFALKPRGYFFNFNQFP